MSKCNDNSKMSAEAVSACMKRCEGPLQEINQVVQQEVGGLQVSKHRYRLVSTIDVAFDRASCSVTGDGHEPKAPSLQRKL